MAAAGALGVIALLIALVGDHPDITRAGTIFTERYEDAQAEAQIAFWLELAGGSCSCSRPG
jgi:hypothetical protein